MIQTQGGIGFLILICFNSSSSCEIAFETPMNEQYKEQKSNHQALGSLLPHFSNTFLTYSVFQLIVEARQYISHGKQGRAPNISDGCLINANSPLVPSPLASCTSSLCWYPVGYRNIYTTKLIGLEELQFRLEWFPVYLDSERRRAHRLSTCTQSDTIRSERRKYIFPSIDRFYSRSPINYINMLPELPRVSISLEVTNSKSIYLVINQSINLLFNQSMLIMLHFIKLTRETNKTNIISSNYQV